MSPRDEAVARIKGRKAANLDFTSGAKRPEPTLDQARSELATSVSEVIHKLFSNKYGPMVGSVSKTTVETLLKNAETNIAQTRHDARLVADEFVTRIFKQGKKKK
jgi:hypothetical protein